MALINIGIYLFLLFTFMYIVWPLISQLVYRCCITCTCSCLSCPALSNIGGGGGAILFCLWLHCHIGGDFFHTPAQRHMNSSSFGVNAKTATSIYSWYWSPYFIFNYFYLTFKLMIRIYMYIYICQLEIN